MAHAVRPGKALTWLSRVLGGAAAPLPPAAAPEPVTPALDSPTPATNAFMSSLVHELRTPLAALSGEVEIALRHERSPASYRDTLARIAVQVTELEDLTSDLALLADPQGYRALSAATLDLGALTSLLSLHYKSDQLIVTAAPARVQVAGHEVLLTRAFRLVLDHAVRYRGPGSSVRLQVLPHDPSRADGAVHLLLDASPPGFARRTWSHLTDDHLDPRAIESPGLVRLRTALNIIRLSGGGLAVDEVDGAVRVRIELRQARDQEDASSAAVD